MGHRGVVCVEHHPGSAASECKGGLGPLVLLKERRDRRVLPEHRVRDGLAVGSGGGSRAVSGQHFDIENAFIFNDVWVILSVLPVIKRA